MTGTPRPLNRRVSIIDEHQGTLLFLATMLLAVATLRLVIEAQAARISAVVVLQPKLWPQNETALAAYLTNGGAATARDILLEFQWEQESGETVGPPRSIRIPALTPGERIPYAPDVILPRPTEEPHSIERLADQKLRLVASWSWTDGRRPLWILGRKRTSDRIAVDLAEFRDSTYGGPQMTEPDAVDRLIDGLTL